MKFNDKFKYAIAPVITAILLMIVYMIKHIYPFGIYTIDYYDMGQQIAAFYFHIFDFLHGEKSLFYDPYTALSVNMAMSTSGCSHLSVFNLFFLFVKRNMLLESLSFFLMLKMMLMSLTMNIYIRNRFKLSTFYEVIFSVFYAFSGYVLLLYMTIQWLDIAVLFPILMLFLHKLLSKGETCGYIVFLTMSIIISYYLSVMVLIYIVLMVGTALLCDKLFKNDQGAEGKLYENYHLIKLLISTVISIMLSMFILLPQMFQTLISARFNNENEGGILNMYYGIVSTVKPAYTTRWWALLLSSFAFSIIAYGLIKYRKEKKTIFLAVMACFIMLSEFIVEGVNLFWHFGSYVQYPIRNGFIIVFTIIVVALVFVQKMEAENISDLEEKKGISTVAIISFCALSVAFCALLITYYSKREALTVRNVFHITTAVMLVTFLVYEFLIIFKKGKYIKLSAFLMAAECIFFGFILIGKPVFTTGYTEDPEQNSEYIRICDQLDEAFSLNAVDNVSENGDSLLFSRVKNPDTSLNANYGLALRRPVLSNWTHLLSPKLQADASKLGYTVQYTRLLDAGGTVFSDALICVDQVISGLALDESLYTKNATTEAITNNATGQKNEYYLYESNYSLPFGITVSDVDYDFENGDTVEIYNRIYRSICEDKEDIAECIELDNTNSSSINSSIYVDSSKALYYFSNQVDTDDYNTEIRVNGKLVAVPSISELDNTHYPAHFNNNALYLGSFSNENVDIEVSVAKLDKNGNEIETKLEPYIVSIDLTKLSDMINGYQDPVTNRSVDGSRYSFSLKDVENKSYFLIPISYDEGYTASVNGIKTDLIPVGGMFMAVEIPSGDSEISLKFIPKGMHIGILITVIGAILWALCSLIDKKSDILNRDYNWLNTLYIIGYCLAMVLIYAVPYVFCALSIVHII